MFLPEGFSENGVQEGIDDLHRVLHLVAKHLPERPGLAHPQTRRELELRLSERLRELLREPPALTGVRVRAVGERRVRVEDVLRVGQARAERVHAAPEEELGRGVEREARDEVLEVERVPRAQAPLDRADRLVRVPLEDVEVRDPVLAEEGARHGPVELPHIGIRVEHARAQDGDGGLDEQRACAGG